MNLSQLAIIRNRKVGRFSSWTTTGRNADCVHTEPGEARILADIKGPGIITHIWMALKANCGNVSCGSPGTTRKIRVSWCRSGISSAWGTGS